MHRSPTLSSPRSPAAPALAAPALAAPAIQAIWREVASAIGFSITRTREAYATSDGRGTIGIGADDTLDADDTFAQLVFHELCHAATEGEGAVAKPDWGLDNVPGHAVREHACLRFGAHLAQRFGLRAAMAPTTDYRAYYDALAVDPLAPDGDPATPIAIAARERFDSSTWRAPIEAALARTAVLAELRHPLGFPWGPAAETCGGCAWLYVGGPSRRTAPVRAGSRPSIASSVGPAAARLITPSPSRCAIRWSGRSPL
jgi:hypothetical protein